jgi:hypothetical protein
VNVGVLVGVAEAVGVVLGVSVGVLVAVCVGVALGTAVSVSVTAAADPGVTRPASGCPSRAFPASSLSPHPAASSSTSSREAVTKILRMARS